MWQRHRGAAHTSFWSGVPLAGRRIGRLPHLLRCFAAWLRGVTLSLALLPGPPGSGEDLTPYRAASKQILAVLKRYGTAEKLGLDEIFVDATPEVRAAALVALAGLFYKRDASLQGRARLPVIPRAGSTPLQCFLLLPQAQRRLAALARSGCELPAWQGHVHLSGTELVQDSRHRPMDLRAVAAGQAPAAGGAAASCGAAGAGGSGGNSWEALLRIGSVIAAEARAAVRSEAGYRTSAGVACNKTLAKLCRWAPRRPAHTPGHGLPVALPVHAPLQAWCAAAGASFNAALCFPPVARAASRQRPAQA